MQAKQTLSGSGRVEAPASEDFDSQQPEDFIIHNTERKWLTMAPADVKQREVNPLLLTPRSCYICPSSSRHARPGS
uniref:Uncharacterized protein n=1 Tax=Knipowitschia caucasica TaxID=637954 RepID=A0AAV2MNJ3_KNICA